MAMTLRLTEQEHVALKELADVEGISMQEAARRAVRELIERHRHRARVESAAKVILVNHEEALRRLGE